MSPPTALSTSAPVVNDLVAIENSSFSTAFCPSTPLPPLINRLGTSWTQTEWNNRIGKLEKSNKQLQEDHTAFTIYRAPRHADESWLRSFFLKQFGITICICQKTPSNSRKFSCFYITFPSKYAWLFPTTSNNAFALDKMKMTRSDKFTTLYKPKYKYTSPKPISKSSSKPLNFCSKPKHMISSNSPHFPPQPKQDSNWSFKTPLPRPPSPFRKNITNVLPSSTFSKPLIPQRNRVSFNLTPVSDPSTSITPTAPISNPFPNFNLTIGAKYPTHLLCR